MDRTSMDSVAAAHQQVLDALKPTPEQIRAGMEKLRAMQEPHGQFYAGDGAVVYCGCTKIAECANDVFAHMLASQMKQRWEVLSRILARCEAAMREHDEFAPRLPEFKSRHEWQSASMCEEQMFRELSLAAELLGLVPGIEVGK